MRLSLKESSTKSLNATNLDRKSGIRGPNKMGEALQSFWLRTLRGPWIGEVLDSPLGCPYRTGSAPQNLHIEGEIPSADILDIKGDTLPI
jgi:hypothetical protein